MSMLTSIDAKFPSSFPGADLGGGCRGYAPP